MYSLRAATFRRSFLATSAPVRSFQSARVLAAGKESALNHDGRAEEAEAHKQDQLKKQKEGKGHWVDELASDSESIIKADRGEIDASADTIEKLQQESVKLSQQDKPSGSQH